MVVYADILILLNFIVDYFLLALTAAILRCSLNVFRQLCGAGVGALSSLYIFLPQSPFVVELMIRFSVAGLMILCGFGFYSWRRFFRTVAVLFAVTFGYGGAMVGLWLLLRPNGMIINNSVVYFNISPLFLVFFSVIAYFLGMLLRNLLAKKTPDSKYCRIVFEVEKRSAEFMGILDSGNSLTDLFGAADVIIADCSVAEKLFGRDFSPEALKNRYRVLPYETISGQELLDGYRCDGGKIFLEDTVTVLERPILAVSKARIQGEYSAIVNPQTIDGVRV